MRFAHMGDCHLGSWSQEELRDLNFQAFQKSIDICIKKKVEFVLISGDLFDSAYPPIDVLKDTFREFRRLNDANIPAFIIAGSHDYSASGKTFLDVLESSGLCKNVFSCEEHQGKLMLHPTIYKNCAIYGYPGKKSGLEVPEVSRIKLQDSPGMFKILMLHTVIRDAIGSLPVEAVDEKKLPKVDYLALSHLHVKYNKENRVYSGPIFPNNISELEELKEGTFCIYDNGKLERQKINLKPVLCIRLEITDALGATKQILDYLKNQPLKDKIVVLRLEGIINSGGVSDIDFRKIESFVRDNEAFSFIKNTSKLHQKDSLINLETQETIDLEPTLIEKFTNSNPGKFSNLIPSLIKTLQLTRMEEEKASIFEERLNSEVKKVLPK